MRIGGRRREPMPLDVWASCVAAMSSGEPAGGRCSVTLAGSEAGTSIE